MGDEEGANTRTQNFNRTIADQQFAFLGNV